MEKGARMLRPKRLGHKLAEIRRQLQLSQNELIHRFGFTDVLVREEISAFERGVRVPPLIVLLEYAKAANVYLEVIVDDALDLPEIMPCRAKHKGIKRTPSLNTLKRNRKGT
jgi:transcriptional regulator with XRE-family HTH domain